MNRSTLLLLILLLVLGAVAYLLLPSGEERQASYDNRGVHFAVDSTAVLRLDIRRPFSTTTIQNVGGIWMVTTPFQYAADPQAVGALIGGLARFKVGSLVSSNPEKQRLFQVDSTGTMITVTDRAGAESKIIFGKMGPSFSEVYFRLPAEKDVYLGDGIDSWMLTREPKEWRDKTILAANTPAITALEYTVNGQSTTFQRDSSGWVAAGHRVNMQSLNPALATMMAFKADEFIDSSVTFHKTPITLKVQGPDPVTLQFYPLDAESTRYAVQSSKSPQLFTVGKYAASQMLAPTGRGALSAERVEQHAAAPAATAQTEAPAKSVPPPVEEKVTTQPARRALTETAAAEKKPSSTPEKKPAAAPVQAPKKSVTEQQPPPTKAVTTPPRQEQRAPLTPPVRTLSTERKILTPTEKTPVKETPQVVKTPAREVPAPEKAPEKAAVKEQSPATADDEGDITIVTVKKGETMTTIAKKYNVTVDQIIKWNQLKSISVKPGMELYIFVKK